MFCCACAGSCNHVGPHSYCTAHGGSITGNNTIFFTTPSSGYNYYCKCQRCPCCGKLVAPQSFTYTIDNTLK